jgi:hypothetical protein
MDNKKTNQTFGNKIKNYFVKFLVLLLIAFLGYFAFVYYVPYSEGVRAGELIKFSRKGVTFKTWEGEMSQGISGAQIFKFTVPKKEKEVIQKLQNLQGRYVKLTYKELYTTFSWWGDTPYFVTDVVEEPSPFITPK